MRSMGSAHGELPDDVLARLYEAQSLWEEVSLKTHSMPSVVQGVPRGIPCSYSIDDDDDDNNILVYLFPL